MDVQQRGIITLLKSAVMGEKLILPEGFSLEEAYPLLKKQTLLTLAYEGAVKCGVSKELPVMQKLLQHYYQVMIRSELQMRALDQLFRAFDDNCIDYLPLKGCNMKLLYPKPELRVMGDADILIHMEQYEKIVPIMEQLGFGLKVETDHTCNWISDSLYVELHKSMIPLEDRDYYAYYGTGWRLAKKGEGTRWNLGNEDAFIFCFAHFARHYRFSGIGCRHVLDLYIYRRSFPEMDWGYVERELTKLRLEEFYHNIMKLLDVWFEGAATDEKTEFISAYIFSGGTWGKMENFYVSWEARRSRELGENKHTKRRSLLGALFPTLERMRKFYPVLEKLPVLLPVCWVLRWFDVLLHRPQNIKRRAYRTSVINDEAVSDYQKALHYVGLDFRMESAE